MVWKRGERLKLPVIVTSRAKIIKAAGRRGCGKRIPNLHLPVTEVLATPDIPNFAALSFNQFKSSQ